MKLFCEKLVHFVKNETVLAVAFLMALLSSFFIVPDREYMTYIDWNTLFLLFSLMAVMAGLQKLGIFTAVGDCLLRHTVHTRQLMLILVFLPFFFSMVITNDVALITFVPFAIIVLRLCGQEKLLVPLVVMQTIAANMGSMLTPMGNPQNLYLFSQSGMTISQFLCLMLPETVAAGVVLLAVIFVMKKETLDVSALVSNKQKITHDNILQLFCFCFVFLLCILCVAKLLSPVVPAVVIAVYLLLKDRDLLKKIDYGLLATFICFFIFIGNMGRIEWFRLLLERVITGHELIIAVISSQIISNVPAALLLSGFTKEWNALVVGTNLGGLGTLIASMASLISYKQIAKEYPKLKGRYFKWFTLANVGLLGILLALQALPVMG